MLRFHDSTDFVSLFETYAHGRYALNGRTRITCLRFAYLYVSFPVSHVFLTLPLWTVNSSMPTACLTLTSFSSSVESLFPDYDSSYHIRLFVLVLTRLVYIQLGMRTHSSSSIYFATTLQVRLVRSHVLSLIPSSSLAKAIALRSLERSSFASLC